MKSNILSSISTLKELADKNRGISYGVVQPGFYHQDGVPIIRVQNVVDGKIRTKNILKIDPEIEKKHSRTRLQGGEVLLTLVGTVGNSAVVPADLQGWNVARAIAVIPPIKEIEPLWIHYCLQTKELQHLIHTWCTTTVQATFNLQDLIKLPIPILPKKQRRKIIDILKTLDERITSIKNIKQCLENITQSIFKSWFIDFDGQKEFVDSELGRIPKTWKTSKFSEQIDIVKGKKPKNVSLIPEKGFLPQILIETFNNGVSVYTKPDNLVVSNKTDSIMVMDGISSGRVAIGYNGVIGSTLAKIVSKGETSPYYTFFSLKNLENEIKTNLTGSAIPHTDKNLILNSDLIIPDRSTLQNFEKTIEPIFSKISNIKLEIISLRELEKKLIKKLISGEIQV